MRDSFHVITSTGETSNCFTRILQHWRWVDARYLDYLDTGCELSRSDLQGRLVEQLERGLEECVLGNTISTISTITTIQFRRLALKSPH